MILTKINKDLRIHHQQHYLLFGVKLQRYWSLMHIIEWKKQTNVWILIFCNLCGTYCFVCDYQRDQRETYWGFILCGLIEYSCVNILSQITQITQRNAASCIISQRKTIGWGNCSFAVIWGLLFWVSSAIISEICERHIGVRCADRLNTPMWIFSRR